MLKNLSFKTIFGWINIAENNQKLVKVNFGKKLNSNESKFLNKVGDQILDYSLGNLIVFNIDIYVEGSNLQKKIWNEVKKIPYGKTKSYGEIAKKLNTSPRYVGNVCGQNKHLLLVPCHRVVRSDGQLGGFSGLGGLKLKQRLLNLENSLT